MHIDFDLHAKTLRNKNSMREIEAPRADRLAYLDGLRGLAVASVFLCHLVVTDFKGHGTLAPRLSFALSHGVELFFVISGFCMALILERQPKITYMKFIFRRFYRIMPPFAVALATFTLLAFTPFGMPGYQDNGSDFIHSLVFAIPLAGSRVNGVYWTIAIEARWYLVAPIFCAICCRSPRALFACALVAYALYGFVRMQQFDDFGYLPAFLFGIAASKIATKSHPVRLLAPALAVIFVAVAALAPREGLNYWHCYLLWHLAAMLIVLGGTVAPFARLLGSPVPSSLGKASYSIYLTHLPVLLWLAHLGISIIPAAIITLAVGFAFWWTIERPFQRDDIRSNIVRQLRRLVGLALSSPIDPLAKYTENPNA